MKTLLSATLLFFSLYSHAQRVIFAESISVSYQMTSNMIFPYPIEKVDLGSSDLIGQKAGKRGNVLLIKAGRKDFAPTNLSVYTSDGKFYSFIVRYGERPNPLNLSFATGVPSEIPSIRKGYPEINESRLDSDAVEISKQTDFLHKNAVQQEMKITLQGIYIKDNLLWFRVEIRNNAEIDFTPEWVRFFVRDKHTSKRTAVQEEEKSPVWKTPAGTVLGESSNILLFGLAGFTISKGKKLMIEASEWNGGRSITLPVSAKTILKARKI